MSSHPNQRAANAVRFQLLTAARIGEVLAARWSDIDLERGVWIKPSHHTKQKRTEHLPLSAPALAVLAEMQERAGAGERYLFPGNSPEKPLRGISYDLAEVRRRLAATARDWLPQLFPHARLSADKKTLRCADLSGRPPRKEGSCIIHLEVRFAGWGFDYATRESAGPIDLIYHATGLTNGSLFEEAARLARMDRPAPPSRPIASQA